VAAHGSHAFVSNPIFVCRNRHRTRRKSHGSNRHDTRIHTPDNLGQLALGVVELGLLRWRKQKLLGCDFSATNAVTIFCRECHPDTCA
jgi:hypothetical protein